MIVQPSLSWRTRPHRHTRGNGLCWQLRGLSLAERRAGPAGETVFHARNKDGQIQRGNAPPNPTEKKLLTHHQIARNRKRSARLARLERSGNSRRPRSPQTVIRDNPLPSDKDASRLPQRLAYRAVYSPRKAERRAQLLRLDCAKPEWGWDGWGAIPLNSHRVITDAKRGRDATTGFI